MEVMQREREDEAEEEEMEVQVKVDRHRTCHRHRPVEENHPYHPRRSLRLRKMEGELE